MKRGFIIIIFIIAGFPFLVAQKTTRKNLKPIEREKVQSVKSDSDTIFDTGEKLIFSGYEKPLRSRKETVHLTNNSEFDISEISLILNYFDYRGEELHSRSVNIKCDSPAGSTRLLSFPSWDVQNRFYYAQGPAPRNEAYQFSVEIVPVWIIVDVED